MNDAVGVRVLLTGFDAFPGVQFNATSKLVPLLAQRAGEQHPSCHFTCDVLPVTWRGGPDRASKLIAETDADVILHFGVSDCAKGFVIETLARNSCVAAIDAEGSLPALELIDLDGPDSRRSTFPGNEIVMRLGGAGLPAELSENAGSYLCNAVLYHTLSNVRQGVLAGFVHLPVGLGKDADCISMDDAVRGGLILIETCLKSWQRH